MTSTHEERLQADLDVTESVCHARDDDNLRQQ
jgi:hypothetical protein